MDFTKLLVNSRKMSCCPMSFVQHFNHVSSKMEWKVVSDDYDYNQEIATSCYGDMLHDTERNQKFALALKKAINKMHANGREAHVLDIGTGTGLLSMLAVKYGADSVVACEAFLPMANCAINIIDENNFSENIKVVKKHSTELTVGDDGDLKQKANILVSEVFDTELIGEGAIKTFNHAHEHLLEDDCIVIPAEGTIYAQVAESNLAASWNQLFDWTAENQDLVKIPDEIKKCPGAAAVHDIQLSQLNGNLFKLLTKSTPIFRFDWMSNTLTPTHRHADLNITTVSGGRAQVVFMWWDLLMDPEGEILLSCAPVWEHPDFKDKYSIKGHSKGNFAKDIPWRDHWMQAVYFLTDEIMLSENESVTLNCYHDEFSFWFKLNDSSNTSNSLRPVCECGVHYVLSRTRVGAMNSTLRREFFLRHFKNIVDSDTHYVIFGDLSLLVPLIGKLGANRVTALETGPTIWKIAKSVIKFNELSNVTVCNTVNQVANEIIRNESEKLAIVAEPFFRNSVLPWDNISFWYSKDELFKKLTDLKPDYNPKNVMVYPGRWKMWACAIQFDDLWKIARRLNQCEGFSMKLFDDLIENAKMQAESYVEPQPLWEYPGIALTEPFLLVELDFRCSLPLKDVRFQCQVTFPLSCRCDGVAIWMEYCFGEDSWLSTGPTEKVIPSEYISWDMFERQGVHLFRNSRKITEGDQLSSDVTFTPETGDFEFNFETTPSST